MRLVALALLALPLPAAAYECRIDRICTLRLDCVPERIVFNLYPVGTSDPVQYAVVVEDQAQIVDRIDTLRHSFFLNDGDDRATLTVAPDNRSIVIIVEGPEGPEILSGWCVPSAPAEDAAEDGEPPQPAEAAPEAPAGED